MGKFSGIYLIRNKSNGKVYVGSTLNFSKRRREHRNMLFRGVHHSNRLQNAWNKYGDTAFEFELIEEVEANDLVEREQYWLDFYNASVEGYNMNAKADGRWGRKHTLETRKKQSESYWAKSIEEHQRISDARKGGNNPFYGKKHSSKTRNKMSEARKHRVITDAHRENIASGQFDRKTTRNTSGFVGVSLLKSTGRYRATIRWQGKFKHIGYFETPEQASIAREKYIKDNGLGPQS